ncbi:methylmalonyl-CoA mutase family protein [Pedobacter sp. UC225_61]|uniref:methylmalonyl-CoA mutase family protein n=1 Tax=Pedobacter sp. UC225_61 TaxID=3374623 RepID=UPI00379DD623
MNSIRTIQTEKLKLLKAERNNEAVNLALDNLRNAAKSDHNLMPFILTAVEEYATLGEIADCMRNVFGEY